MTLTYRILARATGTAGRRAAVPSLTRSYAARYPFTPDSSVTPQANEAATKHPKSPYPFTTPGQPTPQQSNQASPIGPVPTSARPGPEMKDSELRQADEGDRSQQDMNPRQPDYNVASDYRTSSFAPVPMRVMDGSEPTDITPAAVLSGAPTELQARTVRIFKPAKTATQSGAWHGHGWRMDWDILQKGHRWENPLMGWQSSGDVMQGTNMRFDSKEAAILFANKQGYEYYVQEPNERRRVPKAYATQFIHSPGKLKQARTK